MMVGLHREQPRADGELTAGPGVPRGCPDGAGVEEPGVGSVTRSRPTTAELVIFRQDCGNWPQLWRATRASCGRTEDNRSARTESLPAQRVLELANGAPVEAGQLPSARTCRTGSPGPVRTAAWAAVRGVATQSVLGAKPQSGPTSTRRRSTRWPSRVPGTRRRLAGLLESRPPPDPRQRHRHSTLTERQALQLTLSGARAVEPDRWGRSSRELGGQLGSPEGMDGLISGRWYQGRQGTSAGAGRPAHRATEPGMP